MNSLTRNAVFCVALFSIVSLSVASASSTSVNVNNTLPMLNIFDSIINFFRSLFGSVSHVSTTATTSIVTSIATTSAASTVPTTTASYHPTSTIYLPPSTASTTSVKATTTIPEPSCPSGYTLSLVSNGTSTNYYTYVTCTGPNGLSGGTITPSCPSGYVAQESATEGPICGPESESTSIPVRPTTTVSTSISTSTAYTTTVFTTYSSTIASTTTVPITQTTGTLTVNQGNSTTIGPWTVQVLVQSSQSGNSGVSYAAVFGVSYDGQSADYTGALSQGEVLNFSEGGHVLIAHIDQIALSTGSPYPASYPVSVSMWFQEG